MYACNESSDKLEIKKKEKERIVRKESNSRKNKCISVRDREQVIVCVRSLCVTERDSVPGFKGRYGCRTLSAVSFSLGNCSSL